MKRTLSIRFPELDKMEIVLNKFKGSFLNTDCEIEVF